MCVKCNINNCSCNLTTGVRGRRGYKGEKGDPGIGVGVVGQSAYQAWLNNGHSGTVTDFLNWLRGSDGVDGIDGLTAYQIWLSKSGNAGKTEAEFLDSLIGPQGDTTTISVGSTTTLPAGNSAVVSVDLVNSTPTHTIFDFEIPKGDNGDKGDQGNKGDVGTPGPNSLIYQYKSSIEAGACVLNNASFDSLTQVILSRTSMQGLTGTPFTTGNAQDWVDVITVGARFQVYDMNDYSVFGIYTISNKTNSGSGDVTITLLPIVTAGSVTIDTNLAVSYIIAPIAVPSSSEPDGVPVGVVLDFFGSTSTPIPDKWFVAEGGALFVAEFPELFAVLKYMYGGSGPMFHLPDLRGKVVAGIEGFIHPIGSMDGTENVYIDDVNLPQHSHGASFTGDPMTDHSHDVTQRGMELASSGGTKFMTDQSPDATDGATKPASAGTPSGTVEVAMGGGVASPTPISVLQPTAYAKKIIKALP